MLSKNMEKEERGEEGGEWVGNEKVGGRAAWDM